jgi:glycosyltransferase involved in cell wall biosynthesis
MRICYFGHPAHAWSGSSHFFEEILETLGEVTYLRPDGVTVDDSLRWAMESDFDLYVFFQFDFLAYAFLEAQKNVVIVPMIDGSASYGSEHWKRLRKGKFVSYSPTLHAFLRLLGMDSFGIQYWPNPEEYFAPKSNAIYYWPRGHHAYVSVQRILDATRNYPEIELRVRATDGPASNLDYSGLRNNRLKILEINDREEHLFQIQSASIFVAPRPSEGIGHSFLEAMSMGRAVIGRNFPTMSNYISDKESGVFFPKREKPIKSGLNWIEIGATAHTEVVKGNGKYLRSLESLQIYLLKQKSSKSRFKIKEVHKLLDISCQIMRSQYSPSGKILTLQNFANATSILKL